MFYSTSLQLDDNGSACIRGADFNSASFRVEHASGTPSRHSSPPETTSTSVVLIILHIWSKHAEHMASPDRHVYCHQSPSSNGLRPCGMGTCSLAPLRNNALHNATIHSKLPILWALRPLNYSVLACSMHSAILHSGQDTVSLWDVAYVGNFFAPTRRKTRLSQKPYRLGWDQILSGRLCSSCRSCSY